MRAWVAFFLVWLFVLVMFVVSGTMAYADTLVVRASHGELVESPKPCGPVTRDEIWKFVGGDLVLFREAGKLSYNTRDSTFEVVADKLYEQDGKAIGIWYRGRRSIVITLQATKKRRFGLVVSFVVEKDEKAKNEVSCFERWVGSVTP